MVIWYSAGRSCRPGVDDDMFEEESLVLAALLHDIGIFWQLTCQLPEDENQDHSVLSSRFVQDHFGDRYGQAASIAAAHHQPDDYLSKLLRLAILLSSGATDTGETDPSCVQLQSVFSSLGGGSSPRYFPLKPLDIHRDLILPKPDRDVDPQRSYSELWEGFVQEMEAVARLHSADFPALVNTLYHVLCKHTWCIPATRRGGISDVSLFDHLRTACAVALGLWRSGISETEVDVLLGGKPSAAASGPFLSLIAGDICGVQHFVYAPGSSAIASRLRGRSIYVELLTEAAALLLLRQLHLYEANLLYIDGGRFLVLSHWIDADTLKTFRRSISQALLKHHRSELDLALVAEGLRPVDFDDFPAAWARVEKQVAQAKRRQFGDLPARQLHEELFGLQGGGTALGVCTVCGADGARWNTSEGDERECDLCRSLNELGQQFERANYLLMYPLEKIRPGTHVHGWQNLFFFGLGFAVQLLENVHETDLTAIALGGTVLRLGSTDFLTADIARAIRTAKNPPSLGFRFVPQVLPWEKDGTGEVADLATMAEASKGASLVGVLRMDVDDLGWLLRCGLGEDASLSRFCSMSFLLYLFFRGCLSSVCAARNPREGNGTVCPIYAGGDDLFVIGSWSDIPDLAWSIHRDFSDFACCNPLVHISGGTSASDPHMSLFQLSEAARESLECGAKKESGKNAFDFLGQTLGWSQFQRVIEWRDVLQRAVATGEQAEKGKAPPALLHLLMELHQCYVNTQQANADRPHGAALHYGPWMWHAAYHMSQMMERAEGRARNELTRIREALTDVTQLSLALPELALAARWLELLTRTEKQ